MLRTALILVAYTACGATNYELPDEPRYSGDASVADAASAGSEMLSIATFNIEYGARPGWR